jgi:RNA-binding protein
VLHFIQDKGKTIELMTQELTSQQTKFLRGLAHPLRPLVLVGKNGLTDEVLASVDAALEKHELIKVKFIEIKDKTGKTRIAEAICRRTRCHLAGIIGHVAIFYRQARKPSRRKIQLP